MKRIFGGGSYANVTATLALVVALGGTSYAAIKLPKNSVTSVQVKDRSLLKKDFKTGQLPRGKTGKDGPQGPPGAPGAPGASGGAGAAIVNRADAAEALIPGAGAQTVQAMSLPPGSWAVTAKFVAENAAADGVLSCSLNIGGVPVDTLGPPPGVDFGTGASVNVLVGAGTLPGGGPATVVCTTANTITAGTYRGRSIVAVKAAEVLPG